MIGSNDITVGSNGNAIGSNDIIVGSNRNAIGSNDIAVGSNGNTIGNNDIAVSSNGKANESKKNKSILSQRKKLGIAKCKNYLEVGITIVPNPLFSIVETRRATFLLAAGMTTLGPSLKQIGNNLFP